jgi:UDP-N-acetylglucosamine 4,6-dehydratase
VPIGFEYNSGANDEWVTVDEIRSLIKEHVDPDFEV